MFLSTDIQGATSAWWGVCMALLRRTSSEIYVAYAAYPSLREPWEIFLQRIQAWFLPTLIFHLFSSRSNYFESLRGSLCGGTACLEVVGRFSCGHARATRIGGRISRGSGEEG